MNQYYASVNIPDPRSLFIDYDQIISVRAPPYYIYDDSVLSNLAVDFFKSHHLRPKFIVVFNSPHKDLQASSTLANRIVHKDITLDEHGQWKPLRCGLNWEANPSTQCEWHWYDMSVLPEVYPPSIPNDFIFRQLSGIHYGAYQQKGIPPDAILLEKIKITGPTLVRVDVPHGLIYHTPPKKQSYSFAKKTNTLRVDPWAQGRRVGVSIRFDETNWNNWEKCLHAFRSIIELREQQVYPQWLGMASHP